MLGWEDGATGGAEQNRGGRVKLCYNNEIYKVSNHFTIHLHIRYTLHVQYCVDVC